jgi:hypothetical protein
MTSLLWRAAACAGLAASGFTSLAQAQSTTVVMPPRTEYRRTLPAAETPIAQPFIQKSPNGLYQLSITDTGIELIGPKGVVKLTDAGIQIGGQQTPQVAVETQDMEYKVGRNYKLWAASNVDIRGAGTVQMGGGGAVQVTGSNVQLMTTGCANGRPAARLGDQVNTSASPAVVAQGSQTVMVC